MLLRRKNAGQSVYQYSSFRRNLNPVQHARLTLQEIELLSYKSTGVDSDDAKWKLNMETKLNVITRSSLQHIKTNLWRIKILLKLLRQKSWVLLTMITQKAGHIAATLLKIGVACTQIFSPKPLARKGVSATIKLVHVTSSGRQYLTENLASTLLICFLVFISSFMAYQTLAFYVAKIIAP